MTQKFLQAFIYAVVPVVGILFFGWDWRNVIVLYWLENIAVGIVAFTSILKAPANKLLPQAKPIVGQLPEQTKLFLGNLPPYLLGIGGALFFLLHYGAFTLGHGIFVLFTVNGYFGSGHPTFLHGVGPLVGSWFLATAVQILLLLNTMRQPGYVYPTMSESMSRPYKRMVTLHIGIIAGGFFITTFHLPATVALVLVALHVLIDILGIWKVKPMPTVEEITKAQRKATMQDPALTRISTIPPVGNRLKDL